MHIQAAETLEKNTGAVEDNIENQMVMSHSKSM